MRQAQTATIDFLVAVGMISIVFVIASSSFLAATQPPVLATQAQALAGAIYNPYPLNWTNQTVVSPGFVVDHRINQTLFNQFEDVQQIPSVSYEYFVNTTLGQAGTPPTDASNVYSITRYAIHQGNITPIEVVVWLD